MAAPSVRNIEFAEKIFAKLGYTPRDLERVYLTLGQVPQSGILWSSNPVEATSFALSGTTLVDETHKPQKLFGSLLPKASEPTKETVSYSEAPLQDCTFRKLVLTILPTAAEFAVLPSSEIQPFFFTTGKEGSKPIMSFHQAGSHTASWYTWGKPSAPRYANMKKEWTPIKAIVSFPYMWDEFTSASDALDDAKAEEFNFKRHGIRYLVCVEGAKEIGGCRRELGLFPTMMRGDFHSVRKTVEAGIQQGCIEEPEGKDHVAGFSVHKDMDVKDLVIGVKHRQGRFRGIKLLCLINERLDRSRGEYNKRHSVDFQCST
jgi:hypothetical protein